MSNQKIEGDFRNHDDLPENSAGRYLNEKQLKFVQYYAATNNKGLSARLSGYVSVNEACKTLKTRYAQDYINELRKEKMDRLGIDKDYIVKKLVDIVEFDPTDIQEADNNKLDADGNEVGFATLSATGIDEMKYGELCDLDGNIIKDADGKSIKIRTGKTGLIEKIKPSKYGFEIQLPSKAQALAELSKIGGYYNPDKVDINMSNDKLENAQNDLANMAENLVKQNKTDKTAVVNVEDKNSVVNGGGE